MHLHLENHLRLLHLERRVLLVVDLGNILLHALSGALDGVGAVCTTVMIGTCGSSSEEEDMFFLFLHVRSCTHAARLHFRLFATQKLQSYALTDSRRFISIKV